jgi:DMSO/TMAO reductase YedYZ molybdopterin-dependent catalytic subunit
VAVRRDGWLPGALAGLSAGLALVLVQAVLREAAGLAPPPEAIPDRFAPLLSIAQFFSLLDLFHGYNGLKQFGVGSILVGELAVSSAVGIVCSRLPLRVRPRALGAFVLVAWVLSLAVLWPVLSANYRGAPLAVAAYLSAVGLVVAYAVYGLTLAAGTSPSITRRVLVIGGIGAVGSLYLMRRLFDEAAFAYDGHENRGDLQAITPNDRFYSVTKNVVDPRVDPGWWRLQISGNVDRPVTLSLTDLQAMPRTEQETTLMCISNYVGGGLISNAVWAGIALTTLLEGAGPRSGTQKLLLRGADGYTDTVPLAKALDGTCFVAYEMNGEPLPSIHGGPVRLLIPGQFGEKSIKWLTGIELIDHDAHGFYEQQGWGPNFTIPTRSQFVPADLSVTAGAPVAAQGWAFGGDRGISGVEVSADAGASWQAARIDRPGPRTGWTLWSYAWQPPAPGDYRLIVRATDGQGQPQVAEYRDTVPEGATGYHTLTLHVAA